MTAPLFAAGLGFKLLDQTPLHVLAELSGEAKREESDLMDLGSIVHGCLLTGEANVVLIDAPDFRTKAAREAKIAARLEDKTPLLAHKWAEVQAMVKSARHQLERHEPPTPFVGGYAERSIYFDLDGVACRATPDWVSTDLLLVCDYKTTGASAHPGVWSRAIWGNGCAFQAALYRRAVAHVAKLERSRLDFRFIVQETYPPYALSSVSLDPQAWEFADTQLFEALRIWRDCQESGEWNGYPTRTAYAEVPAYVQSQFLERSYFGY